MRTPLICAAIFLLLAVNPAGAATGIGFIAAADTGDSQAGEVVKPPRMMHMDKVRERFGEPQRTRPPVGEPPITRWDYPRFVVYFEHQRVIHAVQPDRPPVVHDN